MLRIHDNCQEEQQDMFGDETYQHFARKALPILIDRAKKRETIRYKKLGSLVERHWRHLGKPLGSICTTLCNMQRNPGDMPRLTMIVVKSSGGMAQWILDDLEKKLGRKPEREDFKRELFNPVFNYDGWDAVLEKIEGMISDYEGNKDVR